MQPDYRIKVSFEAADDAMQGAIAYFVYGTACHRTAPKQDLLAALPDGFLITHDWMRRYSREILHEDMQVLFELYHARVALIAIIAAFEGAIKNFREHLGEGGEAAGRGDAKKHLRWAFEVAQRSTYCVPHGPTRIPMLCSHVDQARRLRNLWMHKNGLVDTRYATDTIELQGLTLDRDADPTCVSKLPLPDGEFVAILTPRGFDEYAKSHIELLHHLHDTIQRERFNCTESYHYASLDKGNDWAALLLGASGLRISVDARPPSASE